jgi:uracil-DNA glycosylase family 4
MIVRRDIFGRPLTTDARRVPVLLANPCAGCPRERAVKVPPCFPTQPRLVAVGMAPGGEEEIAGTPLVGQSGELLRQALRAAGFDDRRDVAYINLGRCRPEDDNFETKDWKEAERRCVTYLERDLASWRGPLLLLGTRPAAYFFRDAKARVTSKRGLWYGLPDGRQAFVENHPSAVLRAGGRSVTSAKRQQFFAGIARMAERVLGRERIPEVTCEIYASVAQGAPRLRWLVKKQRRFFFDIETFDAQECPSRKGVATNPFHPDFRVRGVAIAWSPSEGAWFELAPDEQRKAAVRRLLDPVFDADMEKGAFFGGFDENGLIVPGWVTAVRNRRFDPWLAAVALDTVGGGHSLERLVVDVLHEPQPKAGVDRSRIREMSLAAVGEYAVRDACAEFRLDVAIQDRLEKGLYFQ